MQNHHNSDLQPSSSAPPPPPSADLYRFDREGRFDLIQSSHLDRWGDSYLDILSLLGAKFQDVCHPEHIEWLERAFHSTATQGNQCRVYMHAGDRDTPEWAGYKSLDFMPTPAGGMALWSVTYDPEATAAQQASGFIGALPESMGWTRFGDLLVPAGVG